METLRLLHGLQFDDTAVASGFRSRLEPRRIEWGGSEAKHTRNGNGATKLFGGFG